MPLHRLVAIVACLILAGCGDDVVGPVDSAPPPTRIDPSDVSLYEGSIGLVFDVRPIFKKGYLPTEAELTFPDHPALNSTLDIDPLTNVAILIIQNDSLTEGQRAAFEEAVMADAVIVDSTRAVLATLSGERVLLDDSNLPLLIDNDSLPEILPPFVLTDGVPHLLIPEGFDGLLAHRRLSDGADQDGDMVIESFEQDAIEQGFNLLPAGDPDTYFVENLSDPANSAGCVRPFETITATLEIPAHIFFNGSFDDGSECDSPDSPDSPDLTGPAELVIESDAGGWVRLRLADTGEYARYIPPLTVFISFFPPIFVFVAGRLTFDVPRDDATRFRLLSGALAWVITDRGTTFNQPVIPPARLDFAFQATLTNCSAATLTEIIGTELTRTQRTTFGTSESLQVLSSREVSTRLQVEASTELPLGPLEVDVSVEVERTWTNNTSQTIQTGNTFEETAEVKRQVSRSRELVVPPFSALTAMDFVRTISNVVTPFTQRLRIRARDRETERALSGAEIRTQVESGFFDGVVTRVGGDFVEVTIRGEALTDQFLQAETTVFEVPNACG